MHLPIIFSTVNGSLPDKLAEVEFVTVCLSKKNLRGVSYQD
ncbi:hypothetical protein COO91_04139 [Nostoc flagelliforme CCNUN1]|uniref:Uncharacterized protein n=1 Tax=Nostoc flagelliforme CCNUN1 TaxID=2038116 RepID=A0A2K8SRR9_9NOSO|nr:hypothetical protein COO91_04139 [Nostoc flagelliforme CCNUN1]